MLRGTVKVVFSRETIVLLHAVIASVSSIGFLSDHYSIFLTKRDRGAAVLHRDDTFCCRFLLATNSFVIFSAQTRESANQSP